MNTRNVFYEVISEEMMNIDGGTALTSGCLAPSEISFTWWFTVAAAASGVKAGVDMLVS